MWLLSQPSSVENAFKKIGGIVIKSKNKRVSDKCASLFDKCVKEFCVCFIFSLVSYRYASGPCGTHSNSHIIIVSIWFLWNGLNWNGKKMMFMVALSIRKYIVCHHEYYNFITKAKAEVFILNEIIAWKTCTWRL